MLLSCRLISVPLTPRPLRPLPQLRNEDSQEALAELSASRYVHLVASMDHVNAPLMWDVRLSEKFNWLFHKTHTYKPYVEEVRERAVGGAGARAAYAQAH